MLSDDLIWLLKKALKKLHKAKWIIAMIFIDLNLNLQRKSVIQHLYAQCAKYRLGFFFCFTCLIRTWLSVLWLSLVGFCTQPPAQWTQNIFVKAELLQESILFLLHLFARYVLVMKKFEIEKTKPTFIISTFKTDILRVGLVFSISNCFITKTSLANKWRSFSSSNLALSNYIPIDCFIQKWLVNGNSTTISSHFFAYSTNIFHKTEIQTVILRCSTGLNFHWFKSYD